MMAKELVHSSSSFNICNRWISSVEQTTQYPVTMLVVPSSDVFYRIHMMVKKALEIRNISLVSLSVRDRSVEEIKKILGSSFLGQQIFYWLYDLENISRQVLMQLFQDLAVYNGPHIVIISGSLDSIIASEWHGHTVKIPSEMNREDIDLFCTTWYQASAMSNGIKQLFALHNKISFSFFSALFPYIPLLGRTLIGDFEQKYLPRLLVSDTVSLFSFIDLFWSKNIPLFYKQWYELKRFYSIQFWIAFWSDQFFRAYCYAYTMQHGKISIAQKVAARKLSFSYTKTVWKKIDVSLVKELHDIIYTLDYLSKNGGSPDLIEYIYVTWF